MIPLASYQTRVCFHSIVMYLHAVFLCKDDEFRSELRALGYDYEATHTNIERVPEFRKCAPNEY